MRERITKNKVFFEEMAEAKRRFWVDYLARLIFGAVIVPLWRHGKWSLLFGSAGFLLAVMLFTSVYVVCYWILGLFVRKKVARLFLLYLFLVSVGFYVL